MPPIPVIEDLFVEEIMDIYKGLKNAMNIIGLTSSQP